MTQLDFDSDAFLTLLTDALRAGPGSPEWHEALRKLRAGGVEHADEYRLLVTAREHLESGREYRSIRAGPGFAKRLMTAIDEEATRGAKKPSATTTIAFASAAVMLAVLLIIGYLLWSAGEDRGFEPNPLLANIAIRIGDRGLPPDWQQVGELKLGSKRNGVGLISPPTTNSSTIGVAAYWTTPLEPNEPFSVSAGYRFSRDDPKVISQLFVTDDPTFDPASGITPHELVWAVQNDTARMLVASGRVEAQSNIRQQADRNSLAIRLTFDRGQVSLEHGNKRIWSVASGLDPNKPKYVGVRFLRVGPTNVDGSVFESIQINTRQK